MNDTELYEIVKDVPRELWPEGLKYGSFQLAMPTAFALWIWEGALSRFVSETYYEEPADKHGIRWFIWHHEDWTRRPEYPTRIHALVAAAIERYRSMENDKKDARA